MTIRSIFRPWATVLAASVAGLAFSASPIFAETASDGATASAEINWRTNYAASLAEAADADKKVLLRFTADWCPPCQIMNRSVWPEAEVQAAVAEALVPVELDADKPATRPIAARYGVQSIPTLILVNAEGNELARSGFMSAPELITFVGEADD